MTDDDRHADAFLAGLDVVGDLWTVLVIRELLVAPADEDALLDGVPGLHRDLLLEKLDRLSDQCLVERGREYRLTTLGHRLCGPLTMLADWGRLNLR
ncbi:winged helix-turn-helix transcriptional regulator [Saccharomonospora iraqiensis]|uniref:winged helix-turn-helix transcriptional regulator n=1 Tax=Saccharomonospora iraqiensis TaxID=52698 RepID=UPI00022E67CC|nr:winged helix-turn-helix transcriptional regulator [Saccharomonospora iraqiensis]